VRVAIISDIHGNLHALEAVLAAIDDEAPEAIWCLGDLVGYGPQPNRCCELVAARATVCLVGNHDLGVLGRLDLEDFSQDAAVSARWTREELDDASRSFLESLEPKGVAEGIGLYHGSPRDPVWEYVLTPEAVVAALSLAPEPLVLVGHTHVPLALRLRAGGLEGGLAPGGAEIAVPVEQRWLLNPGSVGQPRDTDPRAGYLMLDVGARRAAFRRIEYPVERTQAEIRERGLPEALAARLEQGV
jgi:predicted phosphodiesterase